MKLVTLRSKVKAFDMTKTRSSTHPVNPLFLNRWSPRSYEAKFMPENDVLTMLEAARWAPSANNIQPWRFIYSMRSDAQWDEFVSLLDPFNASWAKEASALVILISDTQVDAKEGQNSKQSHYNSFDAGAAWAQMALQATHMGYSAHAMAGIHKDDIQTSLQIPERYKIEIAIAIGRKGQPEQLHDHLRSRELPSNRLSLDAITFKGVFGNV